MATTTRRQGATANLTAAAFGLLTAFAAAEALLAFLIFG